MRQGNSRAAERKTQPAEATKPEAAKKKKEPVLGALFVDGETLSIDVLQHRLKFKSASSVQKFLQSHDVPYAKVGNCWWVESSDMRIALKAAAKPHHRHQAERESRRERKPGT